MECFSQKLTSNLKMMAIADQLFSAFPVSLLHSKIMELGANYSTAPSLPNPSHLHSKGGVPAMMHEC